jgi:hypothetical protein
MKRFIRFELAFVAAPPPSFFLSITNERLLFRIREEDGKMQDGRRKGKRSKFHRHSQRGELIIQKKNKLKTNSLISLSHANE